MHKCHTLTRLGNFVKEKRATPLLTECYCNLLFVAKEQQAQSAVMSFQQLQDTVSIMPNIAVCVRPPGAMTLIGSRFTNPLKHSSCQIW